MAVNLMAGRDGQSNDNNDKKNTNIDLKLDRKNEESGVIKGVEKTESKDVSNSKPVGVPKMKKEALKIDVKDLDKSAGAAIPDDIGTLEGGLKEKKSGNWGSRIIVLIVVLLVVGAGVLLYLLNVESQFLRGTVNSIPTSNTNIVDDILSEDFENDADTNIETTEIDPQAEVLSQANQILNQGNEVEEAPEETTTEIPVVEDTAASDIPVVQPTPEATSEIVVPESDLPAAPVDTRSDEDLISEYNLQSGNDLADNLIAETTNNNQPTTINQGNDFTPTQSDSDTTVQPNVMESPEISGDTGPGLWLCVILTALFTYVRYDKKKLV